MLKKNKLALLVSALAISAGSIGVAFARDDRGGAPPARKELHRQFDKNGDGTLDDAERAALHAEMKARHEEEHKKMLAQFDRNKDGKLDDAERAAMMDQKVTEHFQKLDTDGNGSVSLAEFKAGMKLRHQRVMKGPPGAFSGRGRGHGPPPGGDVMIHLHDDDGGDGADLE